MNKYSTRLLKEAFQRTGIEKGDVLFVHSSMMSFGWPEDIPIRDLPKLIFENLKDCIGKEGTLIVPTFNFDFCKGIIYDPQQTPSKNMGAFSEYVRQLPDAKRSKHPMQSIAVVGKYANELTEKDTLSAYETESSFDRMIRLNPKLVLLGADFNFNSAIHWVEEKCQVPYRYWKSFTAPYQEGEQIAEKTYRMFVRDLKTDPQLNFKSIEEELKGAGLLKTEQIGGGELKVYELKYFLEIAEKRMLHNPYFYIENHQKFNCL